MGSKNHEVVPTALISQISGLRSGGVNKHIASLAKRNLVSRVQNAKCSVFLSKISGDYYIFFLNRRRVQVNLRRL
jgi:RIO kinase 2